jgi:nicotinate dehydrogenase subunit A
VLDDTVLDDTVLDDTVMEEQELHLTVNGEGHTVRCDPGTPLLDVLRHDLGLAGPRYGCGLGLCGACFVIIDGRARPSCDYPAWAAEGHQVTTVEGVSDGETLSAVQQAFLDEQAAQCGYCTSGMIVAATALLDASPAPAEQEVLEALEGNLCRCGTQRRIVTAVLRAAARRSVPAGQPGAARRSGAAGHPRAAR